MCLVVKLSIVYKFSLPGTDFGRSFVFIKKTELRPKKYPRKSGPFLKEPINRKIKIRVIEKHPDFNYFRQEKISYIFYEF